MGKRVITATIDKETGKITVVVDGFPDEECMNLTNKIGGKNATLKTKNDIKPKNPTKNINKPQSEEEVTEDKIHERQQ